MRRLHGEPGNGQYRAATSSPIPNPHLRAGYSMSTQILSRDAIEIIITSFFAATRDRDVEAWLATFAEDATSYDPVDSPPLVGHSALRQAFTQMTAAFERIGLAEDFVHIAGNEVAVKWTGRGVGANGQEVVFEGIHLFDINETGKIQTLRTYWNLTAILSELQS